MFTWTAIDRTNVSGVLTSTFLSDTNMTRDQANTGVSLLWFGIVLLEIPSNMVLHRIGPHYWIPAQVVTWGLIEVLQSQVKNAGGWYAARLFIGLGESGFIPGGLYTLSWWYLPSELTQRTAIYFLGPSISAAFGSLISAGSLSLYLEEGLKRWQWLCSTATGVLAFALIPKSPHHTGHLFGGLVRVRGWLTEHEGDILVARQARIAEKNQIAGLTMKISLKDITDVLFSWSTWPYLISLGSSSIRANLLNAPSALLGAIFGIILSSFVDRYSRFGYAIIFAAVWTLAGLITLYVCRQPINVTWLSLNFKTPQKRAVAYAVYIGCSNLGGTYGNQVFRARDAPLYRTAWIACISLGAVWLTGVILQTFGFQWANRVFARKLADNPRLEKEVVHTDKRGRKYRFYW
ncbi:major facilitator superfamily domain-containing protein [Aspergillus crustosus]